MKIIEILAPGDALNSLGRIAENHSATDWWIGAEGIDGRRMGRLVVGDETRQSLLDALQSVCETEDRARISVIPVEASLPRPELEEDEEAQRARATMATREELYDSVEKAARLDAVFLVLVVLSTVVVTIGIVKDNIAAVIGAMVIAPLLGPNIALALATALGDLAFMARALKTNLTGVTVALSVAVAVGYLWPADLSSRELMARTDVELDSAALALASGAAAALSITTGLPAVLVGVMVAVALLPPTAAAGLMLGSGHFSLAFGAGLLVAVNVVCVNLAANVVLLIKGLKPRTWLEKRTARQSVTLYIAIWLLSLTLLTGVILFRTYSFPQTWFGF